MSGKGFIAPEPPKACELCGKVAETRPAEARVAMIALENGHEEHRGGVALRALERLLGLPVSGGRAT